MSNTNFDPNSRQNNPERRGVAGIMSNRANQVNAATNILIAYTNGLNRIVNKLIDESTQQTPQVSTEAFFQAKHHPINVDPNVDIVQARPQPESRSNLPNGYVTDSVDDMDAIKTQPRLETQADVGLPADEAEIRRLRARQLLERLHSEDQRAA